MITYDQQNKFYNQLLGIVEKMGGHIFLLMETYMVFSYL